MQSMVYFIVIVVFQVIFLSLSIAAVIKLQASLSIKVLVVSGLFSVFLVLRFIADGVESICRNQGTLLNFLRKTYISVEMARLEPENKKPSRDILVEDLKLEENQRKFEETMSKAAGVQAASYAIGALGAAIFLLAVTIITLALVLNWDFLSSLLS